MHPLFLEVNHLASRCGIDYPVLIDSQIRDLLEADFKGTSTQWLDEKEPLAMYILAPLKFLMSRYPDVIRFSFSVRPKGDDGFTGGIPVLSTFSKNEQHGYFVQVDLDTNALLSDI
jgi:hypothetical protein